MNVETIRQGLRYWLLGILVEYNAHAKIFGCATPFETDKEGWLFTDYWERIQRACVGYMSGEKTLDGSCSDMECVLAHKADYLFGVTYRAALAEQREARLKAQQLRDDCGEA